MSDSLFLSLTESRVLLSCTHLQEIQRSAGVEVHLGAYTVVAISTPTINIMSSV
ncbi:MAG: hypothetical protein OXB91_04090 [Bryobacterales bacterium]|nr:hypothetical protein [Bryobacterales bacterium]